MPSFQVGVHVNIPKTVGLNLSLALSALSILLTMVQGPVAMLQLK